ncbi:MAG TPA: alpha/beta hydrolase [Thermomicrobiales bacterium]|nr:alpha/beta hydrolase [Thermomicrobiales bacterium]
MSLATLHAPAPTVFTERFIDLPTGVRLPWVEHGSALGIPVLLLHGWSDSWRSYQPLLPYLHPSHHAYALSLRGHGTATRPHSGYRPGDFVADVAAFMDAMGIEAAVIVAHSMGTTIAQRFALDYPDRVLGLALLGAIHTWRHIGGLQELQAAVTNLRDPVDPAFVREFQLSTITQPVPPALVEMVVRESLRLPARVWQEVMNGFIDDDSSEHIEAISAPTLIIWGDQDSVSPRGEQDDLLARIPNARLIVYAGTGHAVHWEQPQRAAIDLVDFIDLIEFINTLSH